MNRISLYKYPQLWAGCVAAYCPSVDQRRGTLLLTDTSGRQNHGTLTNITADDWVLRERNIALNFDLSTNFVSLGSGLLKSNVGSLSFWFNSSNVSTFQGLVGTRVNDGDEFTVLIGGGTLYGGNWANAVTLAVSVNTTYHVVLISDGLIWSAFANGVPLGSFSSRTVNFSTYTGAWEIGLTRANRFQTGWIDDVRLYNRALPSSEWRLLSVRRGIAYETNATKVTRFGSLSGAATRSRNYLAGAF